jgi:hypothetical protein
MDSKVFVELSTTKSSSVVDFTQVTMHPSQQQELNE